MIKVVFWKPHHKRRPIIQNGKFIGAVTYVLVQDSRKGYGIFIENMLEH